MPLRFGQAEVPGGTLYGSITGIFNKELKSTGSEDLPVTKIQVKPGIDTAQGSQICVWRIVFPYFKDRICLGNRIDIFKQKANFK